MGKEVGAMLRDLAEKADRELQELQANLEEGSDKGSARQQPLQQRLIESWQGKVRHCTMRSQSTIEVLAQRMLKYYDIS